MTKPTNEQTESLLRRMQACDDAWAFARSKTPREAWEQCPDHHWLLFAFSRIGRVAPHTVNLWDMVHTAVALLDVEKRPSVAVAAAKALATAWMDNRPAHDPSPGSGVAPARMGLAYAIRLLSFTASDKMDQFALVQMAELIERERPYLGDLTDYAFVALGGQGTDAQERRANRRILAILKANLVIAWEAIDRVAASTEDERDL